MQGGKNILLLLYLIYFDLYCCVWYICHYIIVYICSLMTERSERQVGGTEADKYAYQVGERVYTLRDLQALSQSSGKWRGIFV